MVDASWNPAHREKKVTKERKPKDKRDGTQRPTKNTGSIKESKTSDEPGKTSHKLKRNEETTVRKKRQEITKIRFVCVRGRRPWQGLRGVLEVP